MAKNGESNNIKRVVSDLFPLYVTKSDTIHQLSPTMLSFLTAYYPALLSNGNIITSLIELLNLLKINSNNWTDTFPPSLTEMIKGEHRDKHILEFTLQNLPKLLNRMVYSRILSNY